MTVSVIRRERDETFKGFTELRTMCCPTCGVLYAVPDRLLEHARKTDESWYCPNGHSLWYGEHRIDKLERQLENERSRSGSLAARLDQTEASRRAYKAKATRERNEKARLIARVANGVCPCCNRTFKQLARHMASKHPDYIDEAAKP